MQSDIEEKKNEGKVAEKLSAKSRNIYYYYSHIY